MGFLEEGREEPPSRSRAASCYERTLRSVLRIQTKVQTRGLLAGLSTMKPPGPFSPLRRGVAQGKVQHTACPHSRPSRTVVRGAV